jgi:DNA-binding SARP family transcriptional activator
VDSTDRSQPPWSVRLLGRFELRVDGTPLPDASLGSRKERQLLKLLLLERGRLVPTERIIEALWETPPQRPARQVATLVSRLRAVLGRDVITGGPEAYRVQPPSGASVDLQEAEALTAEASRRLAADDPILARSAAERALDLLERGAPVADEPYAEWTEPARAEAARLLRGARAVVWQAALETDDAEAAAAAAERAIAADPLDEEAYRALMLAFDRRGSRAAALAAFERLRSVLATELGVGPMPESDQLRDAIVADETASAGASGAHATGRPPTAAPGAEPPEARDPAFVGRDAELEAVTEKWRFASAGRAHLLLLTGEAGIGKSTLARRALSAARATGGAVLEARCYAAERSLFLQPIADALRPLIARSSPAELRALAGDAAAGLVRIAPEVATALDLPTLAPSTPELEHRRAFDAVARFLGALATRRPVLLFLDDVHLAGAATLEFVHYLVRSQRTARLLVLATLRVEEGDEARRLLGDLAATLPVGPLAADAVRALAAAMGGSSFAEDVLERTRGHPLFVVELLRSLTEHRAAGAEGQARLPDSLRAAVLARAGDSGTPAREVLAAAAVLGPRFELDAVATLAGLSVEEVIRQVERAHRARLVTAADADFRFSNDLVHEIIYDATPAPIRTARHRRAAALFAGRPEVVGHHAYAAGDWQGAALAWHQAATEALETFSNRDAEQLLDLALDAARRAGDRESQVRVLLARGRTRERSARYAESFEDHTAARNLAGQIGDRALEMQALREMGGDPSVALGRRPAECVRHLEAALAIAEELDDGPAAVDVLCRLAILETNRLRGRRALSHAEAAVARARALGDDRALAMALDGRKNVAAYVGDIDTLASVTAELIPILERTDRLWVLQWTIFESSLVPFARGDWDAAEAAIERALQVNRRSGYHAYQPMFLAQRATVALARGTLGEAIADARRASALAAASRHPWWIGAAQAVLGTVLLAAGDRDAARQALERGLDVAERDGADLYVLRCLGPLAEAVADPQAPERALELAARVEALVLADPEAPLFLHAAEGPLGAARALTRLGAPERALRLLDPVARAARKAGWQATLAASALATAEARAVDGRLAQARRDAHRALAVTRRVALPLLAADAYALLSQLAADDDTASDAGHARAECAAEARRRYDQVQVTLQDGVARRRFGAHVQRCLGGALGVPQLR